MTKGIAVWPLKRTIGYYYLLAYCPPEHIGDLKKAAKPLREDLARQADMTLTDYFSQATPEVCRRIVAFHQNSREPDQEIVDALTGKALPADRGRRKVEAFQEEMTRVAELPQRAEPDDRLHRRRGCQFCAAPCHYGYFTLVSDPRFDVLRMMLEEELQKPDAEQSLLYALWGFAIGHLSRALGVRAGWATAEHLGNLAYCLLTLATAKSRLPFPEEQLATLQEANQVLIWNWEISPFGAGEDVTSLA
jgi:hypothetical protein